MYTRYDAYTNLLRGTVAAFAAGVAGAESVTVLPFDEPLGLPEAFSRRIARNTSSLLVAEAHVAAVTDPAGGSHLVESLTDDMARAAWALFGELEGYPRQFDRLVEETRRERARQIAVRRRPITGVSEFPQVHETLPQRRAYGVAPDAHRYAGEFEAMRDAPAGSPVFLATMGDVAAHTPRARFAANLLAAGGVDVVTAGMTANPEDVVQAYAEAGEPDVVMLAGPDEHYADWGAATIAALRDAGALRVLVAGQPAGLDVDGSAASGVDALAFLRRVREVLA
jgi:methylmalonyl-CoA mutase